MRIAKTLFLVAIGASLPFINATAHAQISGFGGFDPVNTSGGGAYTNGNNSFQLTDGGGGEATSGFSPTAQNIGAFSATYTYTANGGADGAAFILQNDSRGTAALGGSGGALGYGPDNGGTSIQPSAAFELNLYTGNGNPVGENLATNGATGVYNAVNPGVNLASGNPILVNLNYNGTTLLVSLRDTGSNTAYTTSYTTNLPTVVGSSTALVGFSGGDGGISSTQTISNFSFTHAPNYTPLAVTGYNQKMIVPQGASSSTPYTSITASMDQGTALGGAAFYEQGYDSGTPRSGMPHPGGTFVGANDPNHVFQMAADYSANDALLLDGSSSGSPDTLGLATPARLSALSLLVNAGNAGQAGDFFTAIVHHANNSTETFTGLKAQDWFGNSPIAYVTDGRVNPDGSFDNVNNGNPRLYQLDVPLADSVDPVTSIDFFATGGGGHTVIWAVSGVAVPVPEPASCLLLGIGAGALAIAARRKTTP